MIAQADMYSHLILLWKTLTIMLSLIEITRILIVFIFLGNQQQDLQHNGIQVIQRYGMALLLSMLLHLLKRLKVQIPQLKYYLWHMRMLIHRITMLLMQMIVKV